MGIYNHDYLIKTSKSIIALVVIQAHLKCVIHIQKDILVNHIKLLILFTVFIGYGLKTGQSFYSGLSFFYNISLVILLNTNPCLEK